MQLSVMLGKNSDFHFFFVEKNKNKKIICMNKSYDKASVSCFAILATIVFTHYLPFLKLFLRKYFNLFQILFFSFQI